MEYKLSTGSIRSSPAIMAWRWYRPVGENPKTRPKCVRYTVEVFVIGYMVVDVDASFVPMSKLIGLFG